MRLHAFWLERRHRFRAVFGSADGRKVLADIRRRALDQPVAETPEEAMRAEGRRELWLHIQEVMRMSDHEIDQLLQEQADE